MRNDLTKPVDDTLADRLLAVCHGDTALRDRIKPFAHLVRTDPWGYPLVYPAGAFIVTTGSDRRETGTHYTPKSLTEAIVTETLTPIVYVGPAVGMAREQWTLKSPAELLDLKICDPAMGSGAFLVQVCRWLADRLVEAWSQAEAAGKAVSVDGDVSDMAAAKEPLPRDTEARTVIARRLIAERCLYGVDLNPLAVELAKLSIWLVTLAKGRPFGFLDHNLRCGDSLLGIHRLDHLTELSMAPTGQGQLRLFGQNVERAVREAIELRSRLREMPIRDIRDVEAMAHLDANARRKVEVPECVADGFIGEVFAAGSNGTALEGALAALAIKAGQAIEGNRGVLTSMRHRSVAALSTDLPADKPLRRPFHWPLEFPEVFACERGGFDGIIGNPPFLGGQRITGVAGTAFRDWLVAHIAQGRRGSADLVAYFFLRAWSLLRDSGGFGLLAVNTIAEGDTRQVGLEAMVRAGAVIHAADPHEPWPGKAAVVTSRVHVQKGEWHGECSLLGRPAPFISAFLSDREEWSPKSLRANEDLAYQGSIVLGMGFVLSPNEARLMLDAAPKNAEVIFPYINGDDLNSDSEQRPSRWVINFWDWPEERAREYKLPWLRLEETVKQERQSNNRKVYRDYWWQFAEKRPALYHAIGWGHQFERHPVGWDSTQVKQDSVMVCSEVTKHLAFQEIPNSYVMSANLDVFRDIGLFAMCQSSLHDVWARQHSSRLETRLKYSPGNAFETFAFPRQNDSIRDIGRQLQSNRKCLMSDEKIGLTKLYNRIHADAEFDPRIERLRGLQRELDAAAVRAYGWEDIDLDHGFKEVPYLPQRDRIRFTISEAARIEVLQRLSELNRQRYEEEVAQGLHGGMATRSTKRAPRALSKDADASPQPSFDFGDTAENQSEYLMAAESREVYASSPAVVILDFLSCRPGWHAKSDILTTTGTPEGQWSSSISELIDSSKIERQGEKRGTRYRIVNTKSEQ